MTIKIELANGDCELFKREDYVISKPKDFHPMICQVDVFAGGKKIKTVKRPFKWFYKHFTFKSEKVQKKLAELNKTE